MKRLVLHFLFVLGFTAALSAQELGRVIISNAQPANPKFIVSLNGIRVSNEYSSTVSFDFLEERNYKVRLLQAGSTKALTFMVNNAPDYVSKYVLNKDAYGNYTLILESKALIGSGSDVITTPAPEPTVVITPTVNVPVAMNDATYNDMLKSVKKESLESGRLDMAKTFFGNQNLSSAQVLGIVKVFSLENSRVAFAKFAYSRTVDKPNYYKVYDGFTLSGSKKEMSEYIKNNP